MALAVVALVAVLILADPLRSRAFAAVAVLAVLLLGAGAMHAASYAVGGY